MPTEEQRQRRMRTCKLRRMGKPVRLKPEECEDAFEVIRSHYARGMTLLAIGKAVGKDPKTIKKIALGLPGDRYMTREQRARALAMEFEPPTTKGAHMDPTLSVRRVGALWADGFTLVTMAGFLGTNEGYLSRLCRGASTVIHYDAVQRINAMYEKLRDVDPLDMQSEESTGRAKLAGLGRGFAPTWCWDDDTIDDPKAIPEWTGHCGTGRGKWIHERDGIPMCGPCSKQSTRYVRTTGDEEYVFDHKYFRAIFERKEMGLQDFADFLGTALGTLAGWLDGTKQPNPEKLESISGRLKVHVSELKL